MSSEKSKINESFFPRQNESENNFALFHFKLLLYLLLIDFNVYFFVLKQNYESWHGLLSTGRWESS